ncbi:amidohydrolase family protein [Luteolibacter sp. Populi]|uniref:amidohydrolase family protein n=1 Tax=Luteolibacter sp. Populi TaxID=3230487 RepID=UPI0034655957
MPEPDQAAGISLIDCDVHCVPLDSDEIVSRLPAYFRTLGFVLPGGPGLPHPTGVRRVDARGPNGEPAGSLPALMREQLLDAYGVDFAVLIEAKILTVGVMPDTHFGNAIASAHNDWLREKWLAADPRFLGSMIVNPLDPAAAAKEIRRVAGSERIVQVVMTSATRIPLGDRIYWPIYEAACEAGLPVAVHPGAEGKGIAGNFTAGFPSSYLEWHTNLPQNFMAQLTSLLTRGAMSQFPELRFVMVEGGFGWVPHLLWRLDKNWKGLRSTVPWLDRPPSEYVLDRVRFTSQPIEEPPSSDQLLEVLHMIQAERTLMFSSDYPHWDNDSPLRAFPKKLPEDLKERIFWKNAAELYGLEKSTTDKHR